jgi:hypothetical protein
MPPALLPEIVSANHSHQIYNKLWIQGANFRASRNDKDTYAHPNTFQKNPPRRS